MGSGLTLDLVPGKVARALWRTKRSTNPREWPPVPLLQATAADAKVERCKQGRMKWRETDAHTDESIEHGSAVVDFGKEDKMNRILHFI